MYLTVTFKNGQITHIPVSNSHTVQVISPQDQVQDAFSFDGVDALSLDHAGAPDATDPNPAPNVGAAEGATVVDTAPGSQTASAPVADTTAQPDTTSASDAAPAAATDPAHDQAVQQATDAVATASVSPDDERKQHAQAALADIETALAQWPDSAALLDAKAQLEQLAA